MGSCEAGDPDAPLAEFDDCVECRRDLLKIAAGFKLLTNEDDEFVVLRILEARLIPLSHFRISAVSTSFRTIPSIAVRKYAFEMTSSFAMFK